MAVRFQLRRDTATNWTTANPVLALGEPGVETDTLKVKVGDGATAWNSLGYSITKDFTDLTNKPTTLSGYGIVDALNLSALSAVDAGGAGSFSYNNSTGAFTYTGPSASEIRTQLSAVDAGGDGSFSYDNSTGAFTYTGPSASEVRAHFSGGTGVTITNGSVAIGQSVATNADVTFNKVSTSTIDSADSSAITVETDVVMLAGLTVGNHIVPSSSENIDLGTQTLRFRDLYLSGNSAIIGDLALKRHISGGLLVADHTTGNPVNITTHNITANNITAAGTIAGNHSGEFTGNIFTNLIDSTDSSAITVTPDVVLSAGLTVGNHILPSSNENIDLGSPTNRFRTLYLAGETIDLAGVTIKKVGNAIELPTGTVIGNKAVAATDQPLNTTDNVAFANITTTGYIAGPASFVIDPAGVGDNTGTVVIAGNLQVDGTTTTINSTTVEVGDKNIVLGADATADTQNNGAGITVYRPDSTDASISWDETNDEWDITNSVNIASTATVKNLLLSSSSLPAAGNPSIALRTSDNTIYHQSGSANTIVMLDSAQNTMQSIGATSQIWNISNAEQMRLTSTGLGVGTNSPGAKLEVVGTSGTEQFRIGNTTGSTDFGITVNENASTVINSAEGATGRGIQFQSGGSNTVLFSSTGNVGIGVTEPLAKLHIRDGAIEDTSGSIIRMDLSGINAPWEIQATNGGTSANRKLNFYAGGAVNLDILTLTQAGNIGIGTNSPGTKLDVLGSVGDVATFRQANVVLKVGTTNFGNGEVYYDSYPTNNPSLRSAQIWRQGSVDSMRLDTSGNLCIGSTSPGNAGALNLSVGNPGTTVGGLQLWATTSGTHYVQFGDSASGADPYRGYIGYAHTADALVFGTAAAEKTRIDSSGNLLVGTTASNARLHVVGTASGSGWTTAFGNGTAYQGVAGFGDTALGNGTWNWQSTSTPGSGTAQFWTRFASATSGGTTVHNVVVDGDVLVGTTITSGNSGSVGMRKGGTGELILLANNGGLFHQAVGNYYLVTTAGGGTSDITLKKNVQQLSGALAKVCAIRGVNFEFIEEQKSTPDNGIQVGVIAQEVEEQYPEIVVTNEDGIKSVRYEKLVAPLIEAIKELKADNDALKARLDAANL